MTELLIFLAGTAFFTWVSRHALRNPRAHGFYRYIGWECMLALVLVNFPMWTVDPASPRQIVSWVLLASSAALAVHAVLLLKQVGRPGQARQDAELFAFEKTSALVTTGAFRYIRHPMYAALLYLAWGAYLKDLSPLSTALVAVASVALFITALRDEAECLQHFGEAYAGYMKATRRFVPFIF
ncbi:MAG: isoprenylcysteine carboxylmethyltransferase family protein [Rhizobacter sp.]|nr:isoprenylcysteine carboxylmethyltransferase family protein [Rhizobacter sp.]